MVTNVPAQSAAHRYHVGGTSSGIAEADAELGLARVPPVGNGDVLAHLVLPSEAGAATAAKNMLLLAQAVAA